MKISERKQRLRARGIVPVSQDTTQPVKVAARQTSGSQQSGSARKGTAQKPAARPRWQPSPTYQIGFGALYIVFSPFLFYTNWVALHAPALHGHPTVTHGTGDYILQFGMPVVFFLFGCWWFYRGLQARQRRRTADAGSLPPAAAGKSGPAKRLSQ